MLIQFTLSNYRCFKEEVVLNLYPAKRLRHHKDRLLEDAAGKRVQAIPVLALYGANASGKSSLVQAIAFARRLIAEGTRPDQPIHVEPFRLDSESTKKASHFEFVIKHAGVLYTYGFLVSTTMVQEEWLFADFGRGEERLFERVTQDSKAILEFGKYFGETENEKQRMRFVASGTRANQLFLTEAHERNVDGVKSLMQWFGQHLVIVRPHSQYRRMVLRAHTDEEFMQFLAILLNNADTGISDIHCYAENLDQERHFPGMPKEMFDNILNDIEKSKAILLESGGGKLSTLKKNQETGLVELLSLKTGHKANGGSVVEFDTKDESDGTRRMMNLAPAMLDMQKRESTCIVDELDRSLHPHLSKFLVELFIEGVRQRKVQGQLLFTTHEAGLLDRDVLRPDEVWFVEKDQQSRSHLMSLAEYKMHHTLRIEKGYLNGRFGAIPMVGDVRRLLGWK